MSNSNPFIFISYAHRDVDKVLPIINNLSANNFNLWYDKGIEAGTEWPEFIAQKLIESSVVVAFISKNSQDSHNCKREINFAIELKKELLIIYLEDVQLSPGMRMQLNTLQAMFFTRSSGIKEFSYELCNAQILQICRNNAPNTSVHYEATKPQPSAKPEKTKNSTKSSANFRKYLTNEEKEAIVTKAIAFCNKNAKAHQKILYRTEFNNKQEKNAALYITNNAVESKDIIGLEDRSISSNGKDGTVITRDYIYSKSLNDISIVNFFDIKSVSADNSNHFYIEYFNEPSEKVYIYNTYIYLNFFNYIINFDYSTFNLSTRTFANSNNAQSSEELILKALKYAKDAADFKVSFTFMRADKAKPKQVQNAINKYAVNLKLDDIVYIYDDTLSSNGKSGFLITKDAIYFSSSSNGQISFSDIKSVELSNNNVIVLFKNGTKKSLFVSSCQKLLYHFFSFMIKNI